MIEVDTSNVIITKNSTGVILKINIDSLPDVFLATFQHSVIVDENLCLDRIGKSFGDCAIVPVPNRLFEENGTISVFVDGSPLKINGTNFTVTVQADGGSTSNQTCDSDAERAFVADLGNRMNKLVDVIYPVGSIYMSVNAADPSTLFGGTWTQIKDTFLLAAGNSHTAGSEGGAESQTIAAHKHLTPIGHRNNGANVAISGGNGYETGQSFSGQMVVWNGASGSGSYNDVVVPYTGASGETVVSTMPPYLAVYVWQRTG